LTWIEKKREQLILTTPKRALAPAASLRGRLKENRERKLEEGPPFLLELGLVQGGPRPCWETQRRVLKAKRVSKQRMSV
jgi:hypothetical protein